MRLDPKRTQFRHDIPLTLMAMGDIYRDEGRIAEADAVYRRAIYISEYLQSIHKSDISCERDQADSYERLGALLEDAAPRGIAGLLPEEPRNLGALARPDAFEPLRAGAMEIGCQSFALVSACPNRRGLGK